MAAYDLEGAEAQLRDDVRAFASTRVREAAKEVAATGAYPRELHREMGERGFLGASLPEAVGGRGMSTLADACVVEELTRWSGTISLMATYVKLASLPIVLAGSEEQQRRWLPALVSGEALGSYAISEPNVGSNPADLRTTATRDGDGWVINGTKKFIGNAGIADVHVVFARTGGDGSGSGGISVFVFDGATEGIVAEELDPMGMPGWHLAAPRYHDVRVPADALLGEEGDGFRTAMQAFDVSRPFVAAQAVGLAQGALDLATDYALRRHAFDRPIIQHQAIAFMLADMATRIEAARQLTYRACVAVDEGDPRLTALAAMAKMFASDMAMQVTTDAVQVLGGNGYLADFPAERMMRDAKVLQIYEGTNQIQRLVVSRALAAEAGEREPAWPDVMPGEPGIPDGT